MRKGIHVLMLGMALSFAACKSDDNTAVAYDLQGQWNIYEAYRDGALTTTLEEGFFSFEDTVLTTNILGSPISGGYDLKDKSFSHNSSLPTTYSIEEYSKDTMHISTEIRGYDFLFKLTKTLDTLSGNM